MIISNRQDLDLYADRCIALAIDTSACGFIYNVNEYGEYVLLKYIGTDTEVYLNDMFDVVSTCAFENTFVKFIDFGLCKVISNNACLNCTNLKKIKALCCIKIGQDSFRDCVCLESATFNVVEEIGTNAFSNCSSLTNIIGVSNLKRLERDTFKCCIKLTKFELSEYITKLPVSAFYHCHMLESINTINIKSIAKRALGYCYNIISLDLRNLKSIANMSAHCAIRLSSIILSNEFIQEELNPAVFKDMKGLEVIYFDGLQKDMLNLQNKFEDAGLYYKWERLGEKVNE